MKRCLIEAFVILFAIKASVAFAESPRDDLRVLQAFINGTKAGDMVHLYLQRRVDNAWADWKTAYENRTSRNAISDHYGELRQLFVDALGGLPERTPLNPQVVGVLYRDGYRVEKIIFESRPKHYVTAVLFLPEAERFAPPYPGVLVPCGHYRPSKAHDEYQSMGVLCALNGMAALVFDPIDQGERIQLLEPVGGTVYWGTRAHTMSGICAMLLGMNIAQFEIWDGMRAIDYLQTRPEVDPEKIGCTGNSGGGTQTAYLTALDERIKAAAPSCYIHRLGVQTKKSMGDAEQNIFGQIAFGMDHPDYIMMRGPVPIKLLAATHDYFDIVAVWETFRLTKRYYTRFGYSERIDILENDVGHNYNREQREAAVQWLLRWLADRDTVVREPELQLFSEEEMRCTMEGQVMHLEGARSTYDIMQNKASELSELRKKLWTSESAACLRDEIRRIAKIRSLDELPEPEVKEIGTIAREGGLIHKLVIVPEEGIQLPALLFESPDDSDGPVTLYVNEIGKSGGLGPGGDIEMLLLSGHRVLAVDVRGMGETNQTSQRDMGKAFGYDWRDVYTAYLLGKSYVGMRAEDILVCMKFARTLSDRQVHLVAVGNVGVPALHAAALESDAFGSVTLKRTLVSWSDVIEKRKTFNQLVNAVHGVLEVYDLPDLAGFLGDKIRIEDPLNAQGFTIGHEDENGANLSDVPELPGLAGMWYGSLNLVDPRDSDPVSVLDLAWNDPSERGRGWSAEWFGTLIAPADGEIRFRIEASHAGRLKIGKGLIFNWENEGEYQAGVITMKKGRHYPLHILYNHDSGDTGHFQLSWGWEGKNEGAITQGFLRHSSLENYRMRCVW